MKKAIGLVMVIWAGMVVCNATPQKVEAMFDEHDPAWIGRLNLPKIRSHKMIKIGKMKPVFWKQWKQDGFQNILPAPSLKKSRVSDIEHPFNIPVVSKGTSAAKGRRSK